MKVKIISKKFGSQVIDTDTYEPMLASKESTAFKVVEHLFNEWYNHNTQPGAPLRSDIKGMYFGEYDEPAVYSVSGAIRQGIEIMFEEIKERGVKVVTTKDIQGMDIECAFQI